MNLNRINLLDDLTINQIAAGEVIERPASALKELLENAIDSGADRIEVQFEEGGKNLVRVTDNGSGIHQSDLKLALQRHATSKIKKTEDLFKLESMGFRGEALASMGAVSELTLSSTLKGAHTGAKIKAHGGEIGEVEPVAPLEGTQVEIKNLFFNVPARQKFLKSVGGETTALKKVFKTFALAHPEISLSLKQDSKQTLFFSKSSFQQRACEVLGINIKDSWLLEVSDHDLKLKAILAHPKLNLATQQGMFLFAQNRPVHDKLLTQAVFEGYRNLIMAHQAPQVVLMISVPPSQIDVNVHPSKMQVKFQDSSTIFRFVNHSIKDHFSKHLEKEMNPVSMSYSLESTEFQQPLLHDAQTQYNQKTYPSTLEVASQVFSQVTDQVVEPEVFAMPSILTPITKSSTWTSMQVIGQLAQTYIVCQSQKGMVLVDQHAAHERVLFEKLKNNFKIETQQSLLEELIELQSDQIEILTQPQWLEVFLKLGFEFHQRGPTTLAVSSRPSFFLDVGLKPLIERMAEQISEMGAHNSLQDVIHDIWASMSCHGAIRAGKVMSTPEMQALLFQMEEYSFSSFCPHGRPVSVLMSLYDLEKLFKRIV